MSTCNCEKQDRYANCCKVKHLQRVLAKELSIDDELGAEYAYVLALKIQVLELENTLKELCEVRLIKDVQGRTPEYFKRRAAVWEKAFAFFPEYEHAERTL